MRVFILIACSRDNVQGEKGFFLCQVQHNIDYFYFFFFKKTGSFFDETIHPFTSMV